MVAVDVNTDDTPVDPVTQRSRPGLKSLESELGGPRNVLVKNLDVSRHEEFGAFVEELKRRLPALTGGTDAKCLLDAAFANAGIGRGGLFPLQPFQDALDIVGVNIVGVLSTIYNSLKLMSANRGALVFSTSSSSAMYGGPGAAVYSASKHAVKGLTEALSIELGTLYGIRAADTLPGFIDTALMPKPAADHAASLTNHWRLIHPREIAATLFRAWLDSPMDVDTKGYPTKGRLHWYLPEELQDEVDAKMHARGGAEAMREVYRGTHWRGVEGRLKKAGLL